MFKSIDLSSVDPARHIAAHQALSLRPKVLSSAGTGFASVASDRRAETGKNAAGARLSLATFFRETATSHDSGIPSTDRAGPNFCHNFCPPDLTWRDLSSSSVALSSRSCVT
jgi:hypothetical protein